MALDPQYALEAFALASTAEKAARDAAEAAQIAALAAQAAAQAAQRASKAAEEAAQAVRRAQPTGQVPAGARSSVPPAAAPATSATPAAAQAGPRNVLVVIGQMPYGDDEVLGALQGVHANVTTVQHKGNKVETALRKGPFDVLCVVGLGSGSSFVPQNPTKPFPASGPMRDAIVSWVEAGGVLLMTGERAAAHTLHTWFGKPWVRENDYYRRTDHDLNRAALAALALGATDEEATLPLCYNVKACMLTQVPREEQLYAASPGATTQSLVWEPIEVQEGATAVAVARHGLGWIGFMGDVNYEAHSLKVLMQLVKNLRGEVGAGAGSSSSAGVGAGVAYHLL